MIIGHGRIISNLERMIERQSFSQAYLFAGPEKVGKFTVAREFARAIVAGRTIASLTDSDRRTADLDITVIVPETEEKSGITKEKDIGVEKMIEAQQTISLFPYRGRFRVLIIDRSEKMTDKAQNSLLKFLEEPNNTALIILVTNESAEILPTVRSRLQKINFQLVAETEMERAGDHRTDPHWVAAVRLALGRPGLAVELSGDTERRNSLAELDSFLAGFAGTSISERLKLAEKISKDVRKSTETLERWSWIVRQRMHERQGYRSTIQLEKIQDGLGVINHTNANARMVLEDLWINFEEHG